MPLLADLDPNVRATLARTADILREDAAGARRASRAAAGDAAGPAEMVSLDRAAWARLSAAEKRYVIGRQPRSCDRIR
jgi:hypothetical protein